MSDARPVIDLMDLLRDHARRKELDMASTGEHEAAVQWIAELIATAKDASAVSYDVDAASEIARLIVVAVVAPLAGALEAGLFALDEERVRWGHGGEYNDDDCWDACAGVDHDPDCAATREARDQMRAALDRVRTPTERSESDGE